MVAGKDGAGAEDVDDASDEGCADPLRGAAGRAAFGFGFGFGLGAGADAGADAVDDVDCESADVVDSTDALVLVAPRALPVLLPVLAAAAAAAADVRRLAVALLGFFGGGGRFVFGFGTGSGLVPGFGAGLDVDRCVAAAGFGGGAVRVAAAGVLVVKGTVMSTKLTGKMPRRAGVLLMNPSYHSAFTFLTRTMHSPVLNDRSPLSSLLKSKVATASPRACGLVGVDGVLAVAAGVGVAGKGSDDDDEGVDDEGDDLFVVVVVGRGGV